ncbi:hypothetical protein [Rhizobium sp. BK176]|uniref:hypothetical protein n=2 Tax=Rhizobium TaxID=379 RepID=UPI0016144364|nr:hypothetical protein [Rhizobium sp. BK176]MCS4096557.1 hypothetical protein [Rhizobium sp. BK176]
MPYHFDWRPGIGDPTIGGWITVALYFVACVSCRRTMATVLSPGSSKQFDGFIWRGIAIMLFLLGINKQLDIQSAFTEIGRMIAASEGWYGERRAVQFYFIVGIAALWAVALPIAGFCPRKLSHQTWLALAGSMLVVGYVVIRAGSFYHFDQFIGSHLWGLKCNWVLEMTGIVIVLLASEWRRAELHRQMRRQTILQ